MNILDFLQTAPSSTYVAGSGGKTSLLVYLARVLPGTCVLTTTTRVFPFDAALLGDAGPAQVAQALERHRVVCVGAPAEQGKLAEPSCGVEALASVTDYLLVEADGSKRLPLKAHEAWEPNIPSGARAGVLMVGASGFGQPIAQAVHRPHVFCRLTGSSLQDAASPELVARAVAAEDLAEVVLVNQVDPHDPEALKASQRFAATLRKAGFEGRVGAGSIHADWAIEL